MSNQKKLLQRKSIRLKGYDYSNAGLYFITLNSKDRKHIFGKIVDGEMILNEYGKIAHEEWINLKDRFPNFELDAFQIMPDHTHHILNVSKQIDDIAVSSIIGAYKSIVMVQCLRLAKSRNEILGKFWQRSYYDHIIRNRNAYARITQYIIDNPKNWKE